MPLQSYLERRELLKPAHFKVLRKSMGMSVEFIAAQLDRNPRTIDTFEAVSRNADVPEYVEEFILQWWDLFQETIAATLDYVDKQTSELGKPPARVDLSIFINDKQVERAGKAPMTKTIHDALTGHVVMALNQEGVEAEICYAPVTP